MRSAAVIVALLCAVQSVAGLYFHITEGVRKCFIEEVPEETLVQAAYSFPDFPLTQVGNGPANTVLRLDVMVRPSPPSSLSPD